MTKKILVLDYGEHYKKVHPYDVKTMGRHPVHMIEGGEYLTEDETVFDECSDMGYFFLNQKLNNFRNTHTVWRWYRDLR